MRTLTALLLATSLGTATILAVKSARAAETPIVKRTNPATLAAPRGYTHVVEVTDGRTLYIAGQVALDQAGNVVGKGDLKAQAHQVFENLKAALAASGATFDDLVKITIFMTDLSNIATLREVRNSYISTNFPASTLVQVSGLARPEFMLEIEAIAVIK